MHKPDAPCRATAVALAQMEVKMGQNGLTMTVKSHLLDDQGNSHGSKTFVGPWHTDTVAKLNDLVMAVEAELAKVHFEVESDDTTATDDDGGTADGERPKGLLGARLGGPEDQTPQI